MERRSLLKSAILVPFVGLIKSKERKKLNVQLKIGETITVPKGQRWVVEKIEMSTTASSSFDSFTINGYTIE
jgi:hypothetical protein